MELDWRRAGGFVQEGALLMRKGQLPLGKARVARGSLAVLTFAEIDAADRAYWAQQTPQARLRAMELMRRINYGPAATGRLQRLFEVVLPQKG